MPHILAATDTFHDSSKAAFFIAAGVLVAWAVLVSAAGIRSRTFPTSVLQGRAVMAISAVLVVVTAAMGVATAKTPPSPGPYNTGDRTDGVAPVPTPVSKVTNGPIALAANPSGTLSFNTTSLAAASSHVTIDFTNKSPLPHNVTIANAAGKVLGATPTFSGATKQLRLDLPPGTYTFFCSVPGHEAAGMKGTLIVH